MKSLNNNMLKALSAAVVAVLVTACDGGTSKSSNMQPSSTGNSAPKNNLDPVALSHDNYQEVAGQSLKSLLLNEASTNALNKSVVITTNRVNPFQDTVTGIAITIPSFSCSNSGTMEGSASFLNTNTDGGLQIDLSRDVTGTLTASFEECVDQGFGLDGEIEGVLNGNIVRNNFGANLNVTNLKVQQPNLSEFVFDGEFNYKAFSDDFISVNIEISSSYSLYVADDAYTQFDLTMNKIVNNTTGEYSYWVSSEFTDSMYPDAYVAYETLQPLVGQGFSLPTGGQLAVQGSNGTVYVYPEHDGALRLELDLDDDGTIDQTDWSTWEDLVLGPMRNQ
jgi:hypothetical protein